VQILLAEDDGLLRTVTERTLARSGHTVVAVDNGLEAWEVLQRDDAPRIAVLDWLMPGLDGTEICRRLRNRTAASYTYVILVTAKSETEDIVAGLDAGADDYIVKPLHPDELSARLRAGCRIVELERQLLEAKERIREQATLDSLTEVLNRGAVEDRLRHELRRAARERGTVGIVLADIDHFKSINDTHGHAAGDTVLKETAHRMRQSCRSYDWVGRYGGEEFLLIAPNCSVVETMALAERVRHTLGSTPVATLGADIAFTASLGVAVYEAPQLPDADTLVRAADEALYRAKRAGRNRVEVAPATSRPDNASQRMAG
jgi:diguanylate cyclase (GGDEF)-like protein